MLEPAQTILLLVIVILAVLFLVLGIQVFFILKDFRKTISKANKVLDDASLISETVSKPVSFLGSQTAQVLIAALAVIFNLKKGKDLLNKVTKDDNKKTHRKERNLEIKVSQDEEKIDRPVRRFFRGVPRTFYRS